MNRRFNPLDRPTALPWGGWEEWHERTRRERPVAYFFFETIPSEWRYFVRRIRDAKWWVLHRTVHRYNVIRIPSLKPGYYDLDTRLLYGSFDLLVEYVEVECAGMHRGADRCDRWLEEEHPRRCAVCRIRRREKEALSGSEAGLLHLNWEIHATEGAQSASAMEARELYLWWTLHRPARPDPHEGYPEREDGKRRFGRTDDAFREWAERANRLEAEYRDEDTRMLQRLAAIRCSLWT